MKTKTKKGPEAKMLKTSKNISNKVTRYEKSTNFKILRCIKKLEYFYCLKR